MTTSASRPWNSGRVLRLDDAAHQDGQVRLDPDGDAAAANVVARLLGHQRAAARCQHLRTGGKQAGDDLALALAKVGLPVVGEDLRDRLAGRALDLLVRIDERQVEARRQPASDGGFSATGHADQHDGPGRPGGRE